MKKRLSMLLAALMLTTALTGCNSGGGDASGDSENGNGSGTETYTIKFNSIKSSSDEFYGKWSDFCDRIEEASNGTLNVEIYPTESLGKTTDMIEAISKGAAVMQDCDTTHLADYVPDLSVFMHPYLLQEPEQIEKLWKSDLGQELMAELEAQGLHVVTLVYFGTRHMIGNTPVTQRSDAQNLKIRCAQTKMWNEVAKVLGGHPTNTAWTEVYNALSQGVADAAESPIHMLYSAKLYEPVKNVSLTGHLVAHTCIVMSEEVYQSLPADAQAAIDLIGSEYPALAIEEVMASEATYIELMEDAGVTFYEVDKTDFIEAAKSVSDAFPEWSEGLYDRVLEAIQ